MTNYELTWTWNSAAAGCHAALEEIGADYRLQFIDLSAPWSEQQLALNPHRKLPTLIDYGLPAANGEGPLVIYQSGAILHHLADRHPDAELVPPTGTPTRALCHQWMFFMAEMLQPSMMMVYYPERYSTAQSEEAHSAVREKGISWTEDVWSRIDHAVGQGAWFLGEQFSICDLYMLTMAMWNLGDDTFKPLTRHTNITRLVERIQRRPAVERMIAAHYLAD